MKEWLLVSTALMTVAASCGSGNVASPNTVIPPKDGGSSGASSDASLMDSGGESHGDSGSGSSGGGPVDANPPDVPHIITGCPKADAGASGVWQNVSPPIKLDKSDWYHAAVVNFAFNPQDLATIYVGTNSEGIYKTTDCGANWVHISTGRLGTEVDSGRQWTIAVDPVDPNVVYANSGYGGTGLYKSANGGVDWDQLFPPSSEFAQNVPGNFVEFVAIDPTNHQHLVVTSHNACMGAYASPVCLAESMDAGATWKMMKGPSGWSYEGGGQVILDMKTWLWLRPGDGIWRTEDEGVTWTQVYKGYAANQTGELYRTSNGSYFVAGQAGIVTSKDAINWQLLPNSPGSTQCTAGDGKSIFVDVGQFGADWSQPGTYFRASQDSPTSWTPLPAPGVEPGWVLRYDRDHHILYSSNSSSGLWALVVQ